MADVVSEATDDLIGRIKRINSVRNKTVEVYDQEEFLCEGDKLRYPSVAVLYVSMRPTDHENATIRRETLNKLTFYVVVMGAPYDQKGVSGVKDRTTKLLDDLRNELYRVVNSDYNWSFRGEFPLDLLVRSEMYGYYQIWDTTSDHTSVPALPSLP